VAGDIDGLKHVGGTGIGGQELEVGGEAKGSEEACPVNRDDGNSFGGEGATGRESCNEVEGADCWGWAGSELAGQQGVLGGAGEVVVEGDRRWEGFLISTNSAPEGRSTTPEGSRWSLIAEAGSEARGAAHSLESMRWPTQPAAKDQK
jgi:hypothetical protein